jgi:hypothetical protein
MLQGIIKSMPEYATHIRAGVIFPREGREFIVDPEAMEELAKHARQLRDEADRAGAVGFQNPDRPVVFHVADPNQFNKNRTIERRGRLIDLPGKPLVLDEHAYEYMKQAFGTQLHCEPLGGAVDPMAAHAQVAALEDENARLRAQLDEASQEFAKFGADYADLRTRLTAEISGFKEENERLRSDLAKAYESAKAAELAAAKSKSK